MIAEAAPWPFLRNSNPLIVQTIADYATGTATVAASGTTVTFSSTIADSKLNQYIQFASSKDWYKITAHTAGTSTATIDPASISTNTAASYTIRKFYYTTDSTVDRILEIRQSITPYKLVEFPADNFHLWQPDPRTTGVPKIYFMMGKDSSDSWQFGLWPIPDAPYNLYIEYLKAVVDLSSDSDVSPIPAKWHTSILLKGAIWQGLSFLGDARANTARDEFLAGIEEMKSESLPSLSTHRLFGAVDTQITSRDIVPFPGQFPRIYG